MRHECVHVKYMYIAVLRVSNDDATNKQGHSELDTNVSGQGYECT